MGASFRPVATPDRWKTQLLSRFEHSCTSPAEPLPCNSLHVLVVDDNEINRLLAVEALQHFGIVAMQAEGGQQAVALACELEFDLILMDLQMPGLGGAEAARQIRAFEGRSLWARVPIVAYSSPLLQDERQSLRSSGIDDVLDKPCAIDAMSACVHRWCSESRLSKREIPRSSRAANGAADPFTPP